jgi:hypothetical protein
MQHQRFEGCYRHALAVDRIETGDRVADDDRSIREPIEVLVAVPAVRREGIVGNPPGNLWMLVEKLPQLGG